MKWKSILTAALSVVVLTASAVFSAAADVVVPAKDSIAVEKIDFQRADFIRGMDVSSVIALENAGVTFRTEAGEEQDIFRILSDNGVNYIRVRVWLDPYDSSGNGYGGGNNDLDKAKIIGQRAAQYGMKLLVDFHYSDFWADPSKQKEPKAWAGLSAAQKSTQLYHYTLDSLNEIKNAGADIGMVQIGNETTSGIAGVFSEADRAALFRSGADAVRAFDGNVKVVLHFTDPQNTATMKWFADYLHQYNVDYDVFATSYYPCWHGSLANLTAVFNYVADTYGKETMVAETSYPYTLEDTDGHGNTISYWNNNSGANMLWAFTPQGQANEVRAVMNAVNQVHNGKGLGMFYWEGAWITVGGTNRSENLPVWQQYGCGWASSYAGEYDPDDAGQYYGGSAVDNQAFFDAQGKALPSLRVYRDVLTGSVTESVLTGDVNGDGRVNVNDVTDLQRFLAEIIELTPQRRLAADVDRDGVITVDDASYLQRYLAEFEVPYAIDVSY